LMFRMMSDVPHHGSGALRTGRPRCIYTGSP
jgi:hypothetical protein